MPRLLSDEPCTLVLNDNISNTRITLHFRMPTTAERVKYLSGLFKRKGNELQPNVNEIRAELGAEILLGFEEGAFTTEKGIISSNPNSPLYEPSWKDIMAKYAPDVIEMLAIHVFERALTIAPPEVAEKSPF